MAIRQRDRGILLPFIVAMSGLVVIFIASFAVRKFNPTSPSYNLWAFPPVFVALGIGLSYIRHTRAQLAALLLWLSWIATQLYAGGNLVVRGNYFAHGTHPQMTAIIDALGPENVTVVHTGTGFHGMAYYPLWYTYRDRLAQFNLTTDGHLRAGRLGRPGVDIRLSEIATPFVLLVFTREATSAEIAASINGASSLNFPDRIPLYDQGPTNLKLHSSSDQVSFIAARVWLLTSLSKAE